MSAAALVVLAYLIGSMPFSFLVARAFGVRDVRRVGSGNVGATNVLRSAGRAAGALAFLLDAGKGALAAVVAGRVAPEAWLPATAAVAAVVGHMYPLWLRFEGGKGVATGLGAFVPLAPWAALAAAATFVVVAGLSRYVSLGSVAGAVALAALVFVRDGTSPVALAAACTAALVVWRHRSNLRRIFGGSERRLGSPRSDAMRISVVGGGAWGTALAAHCARAGLPVRLWVREPEVARAVNEGLENTLYLPGVPLPAGLRATPRLDEAVADAEAVLVVVPSEFCRAIYRQLPRLAPAGAILVSATKGLEIDTLQRMSEVAAVEAPSHPSAVLSGPSFAAEVARALPTAVVVASGDHDVAEAVQRPLATRSFRVYSSEDVVGVELAGALKNVIAIAAGIIDGLGYGHNTVAALITRGLAEITRLAVAEGARPDTLAGLAGLGDLVLTCTGGLSRNRTVGARLGQGLALAQASAGMHPEGVRTTLAACALAERRGIEMPIARQMRAVLHEGKPAREALDELMLRSLKRE